MQDYNPARVINFHPTDEHMDKLQEKVDNRELRNLMGYLMMWAAGTYSEVNIHAEGETDFVAFYNDPKYNRGYTIGAIWQETERKYTTHS